MSTGKVYKEFDGDIDTASLLEGIQFVEDNRNDGCICPCCNRQANAYIIRLDKAAIEILKFMCLKSIEISEKESCHEWLCLPDILKPNGLITKENIRDRVYNKLGYWKLIEPIPKVKGEPSRGVWRITRLGRMFLKGKLVPEWIKRVNGEIVEVSEDLIDINKASEYTWRYSDIFEGEK
jgi:hypothetical protein